MRYNKKQKVLNYIKNNKNGFSVKLNTLEEIKTGYVVSFTHIKSDKNLNVLIDKIDFISLALPQIKKDIVLGGWYDKISNSYFIDLGINTQDRNKALIVGNLFKQIAIFNLNDMSEIKL